MLNLVFAMLITAMMMMMRTTTTMMMMRTIVLLIWSASYNPVASGWPASSGNELAPDAHLKYSSTVRTMVRFSHVCSLDCNHAGAQIHCVGGKKFEMTAGLTEWMWMGWLVR